MKCLKFRLHQVPTEITVKPLIKGTLVNDYDPGFRFYIEAENYFTSWVRCHVIRGSHCNFGHSQVTPTIP